NGTIDTAGMSDGTFRYTPPPDWNGETTFTYVLGTVSLETLDCTATTAPPATVTITVTPVNDAPTTAADAFTALAGQTLNVAAPGVLGNDADVDGDPLTAVKKGSPAHGLVTLAADGGFSYTP